MWRRKDEILRRNVLRVHFHLVRFHFFSALPFLNARFLLLLSLSLGFRLLLSFPLVASRSSLYPRPPRDCLSPINRESIEPVILNFLSSTVSHRHSLFPIIVHCIIRLASEPRCSILSRAVKHYANETLRFFVAWIKYKVTILACVIFSFLSEFLSLQETPSSPFIQFIQFVRFLVYHSQKDRKYSTGCSYNTIKYRIPQELIIKTIFINHFSLYNSPTDIQ